MTSEFRVRIRWTEEEDRILRQEANIQLNQGTLNNWTSIAAKLPGRTNKDCRKRWIKVCKDVNRGAWGEIEDARLISAVARYGTAWTQVAGFVGTRHGDQCAKRWQHALEPSLDHSEWTPEDDERLLAAVRESGRNWKGLSERDFVGRSSTDLKNRHAIITRRRQVEATANLPPTPEIEVKDFDLSYDMATPADHSEKTDSELQPLNPTLDSRPPQSPILDDAGFNSSSLDHSQSMPLLSDANWDFNFDLHSDISHSMNLSFNDHDNGQHPPNNDSFFNDQNYATQDPKPDILSSIEMKGWDQDTLMFNPMQALIPSNPESSLNPGKQKSPNLETGFLSQLTVPEQQRGSREDSKSNVGAVVPSRDGGSRSPEKAGTPSTPGPKSLITLVVEDVEPSALKDVMESLFEAKIKFKMETWYNPKENCKDSSDKGD